MIHVDPETIFFLNLLCQILKVISVGGIGVGLLLTLLFISAQPR